MIISIKIQAWNDYNLRWNSSDYGNITSIRVLSGRIWTPGKNIRHGVEYYVFYIN